jgi:protoporphyrinogen oxidase
MTTIVDPAQLGGHSLVYLPKYMLSDDPAFAESDDEIRERCLSTLEKMHPHFSRDDVLAFRTSRARYVMALPTLGYSERLPPMQTSIPGVYAVNSAHILKGNLNVNETIQIAEEAVAGVLAPAIGVYRQSDGGEGKVTTEAIHHDETNRELVTRP